MASHLLFVPAKTGNDKAHKNHKLVGTKPLWIWALHAALGCNIGKVVISTDDDYIDGRYQGSGVVHRRAPGQGFIDAIIDYCNGKDYEWIWLFQPTSPFVRQSTIEEIKAIIDTTGIHTASVQTITEVQHNDHWMNQRQLGGIDNKHVEFIWHYQRLRNPTKQTKHKSYKFGNLVVSHLKELTQYNTMFSTPSIGVEINRWEALDVDTAEDLVLARLLHKEGLV